MKALEIDGLTVVYKRNFWSKPKRALDGLTMSLEEGQIFGYLGANGAGKTTTIKALVGLLYPTSGTARIFGTDVRDVAARRLVGFQPENPYFYEYLTAIEALRFYAALCNVPRRERDSRSAELLEFVDLTEARKVRVGEFSKGMRQRLGIAQAIIHRPRMVILDEPMSGLDPVGRRQVREVINNLRGEGLTVFFSSHILADVEMIADQVALLVRGRLHALGNLGELLHSRIRGVEIVVDGLTGAAPARAAAEATRHEPSPEGHVFFAADWEHSDRIVRTATEAGGRVRLLRPERETLEEYFMRENHLSREEAGDWSGGADR
jgi:ABC-2 type transport system ATP-binding protein